MYVHDVQPRGPFTNACGDSRKHGRIPWSRRPASEVADGQAVILAFKRAEVGTGGERDQVAGEHCHLVTAAHQFPGMLAGHGHRASALGIGGKDGGYDSYAHDRATTLRLTSASPAATAQPFHRGSTCRSSRARCEARSRAPSPAAP